MAFFNDLVRVIAEAEGMDLMTVRGIGIIAREAGYISKGGRGLSAARMTVRDAANLLIAVNGSDKAKDAATVIPIFRDLVGLTMSDGPDATNLFYQALNGEATFGTKLELLICAAIEMAKVQTGTVGLWVVLSFFRPMPKVHVEWGDYSNPDKLRRSYSTFYRRDADAVQDDRTKSDRQDVTTITDRTLSAVARLLLN